MPVSHYFGGHGTKVMSNMQREYGAKKGKRVFYATMNKRKAATQESMGDVLRSHAKSGTFKRKKRSGN